MNSHQFRLTVCLVVTAAALMPCVSAFASEFEALSATSTSTSNSEALPPSARVAGQVFHDLDADGQLDAGEGPVPVAFLFTELFFCSNRDGRLGSDVIREEDAGTLHYDALPPGSYQLRIELPVGWEFSRGGFDDNGEPVSPIRSVQTLNDGRGLGGFTDCLAFDGVADPVLEIGMRPEL